MSEDELIEMVAGFVSHGTGHDIEQADIYAAKQIIAMVRRSDRKRLNREISRIDMMQKSDIALSSTYLLPVNSVTKPLIAY